MRCKVCYILFFLSWSILLAQGQEPTQTDVSKVDTVVIERVLSENISTSLILDNTRTKIGRDFYESFYQDWSQIAADTSQSTSVMLGLNPEDYIITIDEAPSPLSGPGRGSDVIVLINDQNVWQRFVTPQYDVVVSAVDSATEYLKLLFMSQQEIQRQRKTEDVKETGRF